MASSGAGLGFGIPVLCSQLCHRGAVRPWACHCPSLFCPPPCLLHRAGSKSWFLPCVCTGRGQQALVLTSGPYCHIENNNLRGIMLHAQGWRGKAKLFVCLSPPRPPFVVFTLTWQCLECSYFLCPSPHNTKGDKRQQFAHLRSKINSLLPSLKQPPLHIPPLWPLLSQQGGGKSHSFSSGALVPFGVERGSNTPLHPTPLPYLHWAPQPSGF